MKARTLLQQSQIGGVGAQKTICATVGIGEAGKGVKMRQKHAPGAVLSPEMASMLALEGLLPIGRSRLQWARSDGGY